MKQFGRLFACSLLCAALLLQGSGLIPWAEGETAAPDGRPAEPAVPLGDAPVENCQVYADNARYSLLIEETTLNIGVLDKETGQTWFTFPAEAAADPLASDAIREQMQSHLILTFYNKKNEVKTLNSFKDCVKKNQYTLLKADGGIRVEYVIGAPGMARIAPLVVSAEAFEALMEKLEDEKAVKRLELYYKKRSLSEMRSDKQKQESLQAYPCLEYTDIYVLTDKSVKILAEMEGYFKQAGYTLEQMEKEYEFLKYDADEVVEASFTVPVEYTINDKGLKVSVINRDILYDTGHFYLYKLSVLSFMCASSDQEEGYVFIPDGSGSAVPFNRDKSITRPVNTGKLYGYDPTNLNDTDRSTFYALPVYGLVKGERAVMAVITEDAAGAEITNEVSQFSHSYNTVYSSYTYLNKTEYKTGDVYDLVWMMFEKSPYLGNYTLEFTFLDGEEASYSGMAGAYRARLLEQGMPAVSGEEELPLYIETLGSIKATKRILGIPMKRDTALTSFDEDAALLQFYKENEIEAVCMKLSGWVNGGLDSTYMSRLSIEGVLGGKKSFRRLADTAEKLGYTLYPALDFLKFWDNAPFDGYSMKRDGTNTIDSKAGMYLYVNEATQTADRFGFLPVNTDSALKCFDKVSGKFDALGTGGLALDSVASSLPGDFKKKNGTRRQEAVVDLVTLIQKATQKTMLDGANSFMLPYADHILNLPLSDSGYQNYGRSVPFLQMVLHGSVGYAAEPLNMADDLEMQLLKSVEYGAAPYFVLAAGNVEALREHSFYSRYFSVSAAVWKDQTVEIYHRMKQALEPVAGAAMRSHEALTAEVFKTTYDNGVAIVVNYGDNAFVYGDKTVSRKSYEVLLPS